MRHYRFPNPCKTDDTYMHWNGSSLVQKDDGPSLVRRQDFTWTCYDLSSIETLATKFNEISTEIRRVLHKIMTLKMSAANIGLSWPQCAIVSGLLRPLTHVSSDLSIVNKIRRKSRFIVQILIQKSLQILHMLSYHMKICSDMMLRVDLQQN